MNATPENHDWLTTASLSDLKMLDAHCEFALARAPGDQAVSRLRRAARAEQRQRTPAPCN